MNPLVIEFVGVIVRWALGAFFGWLLAHGVLDDTQAHRFLDAATSPTAMIAILGLLSQLAWALYRRYWNRKKLVTALAMPPSAESEVDAVLKLRGVMHTPPATMARTTKPYKVKQRHPDADAKDRYVNGGN